jgi:hypothetical protein
VVSDCLVSEALLLIAMGSRSRLGSIGSRLVIDVSHLPLNDVSAYGTSNKLTFRIVDDILIVEPHSEMLVEMLKTKEDFKCEFELDLVSQPLISSALSPCPENDYNHDGFRCTLASMI